MRGYIYGREGVREDREGNTEGVFIVGAWRKAGVI